MSNKTSDIVKTLPGIFLMFTIAVIAMGGEDLGIPWQGLETYFKTNPYITNTFIKAVPLNYILLCILSGIIIGNLINIPK